MTNIQIIDKFSVHKIIEESQLAKLPNFEEFKQKNHCYRDYSPIARGYVYTLGVDLEDAIDKLSSDLMDKIYEADEVAHIPMRTVGWCINYIEREGFSETFAKNLIASMELNQKLYLFPSVFGEPEEDWVTPQRYSAILMRELSVIDQTEYLAFLEGLERDDRNLGNRLIESDDSSIKKFLEYWSDMGVISFTTNKQTKVLCINQSAREGMDLKEKTITLDKLALYSVKYPNLRAEDLAIYFLAKAAFPKGDEDLTFFTSAELVEKLKKGGLVLSVWENNITKALRRVRESGLVKTAAIRTVLLGRNGDEIGYGSEPVYAVL